MNYRIKLIMFSLLLSIALYPGSVSGCNLAPDSSGYVDINGARLYFEIHGKGMPLVYLHGGLSSGSDFAKYLPELSKHYQIITIDRRGHGRSFDNGNPYSYSSMADDMSLTMEKLGIKQAIIMGWSDGAVTGYQMAAKYPLKVNKLVAVGANYYLKGIKKETVEWIKTNLTPENISKTFPSIEIGYKELNPSPGNFSSFISKTREMWLRDPYITKAEIGTINIPVLVIAGDRDDITLEHTIEMFFLLKNAQLYIVPAANHMIFAEFNGAVFKTILNFLEK